MTKKIISILLAVIMALGCFTGASADTVYPKTVSEGVRIADGIAELIGSLFGWLSLRTDYPDSAPVCDIPELDKGYVPQGFCYIEDRDMFAVTGYSTGDDNSIVSLINASSGEKIVTVKLCYEDASPCKSHAGGVADMAGYLIISTGKSVRRIKIDDILSAVDFGGVCFCGQLNTDMQASYVASYGNKLFVGQFYTFTLTNTYETPAEQRIYASSTKRNYAMCEEFDLTDIDKVFEDGTAVPEFMISVPNSVQGVAFDGETFVTSSSYTQRNASKIRYYKLTDSGKMFSIRGNDVPLYILLEKDAVKTTDVPPMAEGIDWYNGRVAGIFESGADKFSPTVRTKSVCVFN